MTTVERAKKRIERESCDYLTMSALLTAAASSATHSATEVKRRNTAVDGQLEAEGLMAVNVVGDGNCFFRALSVILYRNEDKHLWLREAIVQHVLQLADADHALPGINMDVADQTVRQQLENQRIVGTWAGEDMIVAAADFLKRPVHIYTFTTQTCSSPLVYSPVNGGTVSTPLCLAFYLPGHYKAVCSITTNHLNGARR